MKKTSLRNYKSDKYYPKVVRAVTEIFKRQDYISPVDLFLEINRLEPKKLEDWRFGRIPFLEKVINGRLSVLERILRILCYHAKQCKLKESFTGYKKWGKGAKLKLRFTKTGKPRLEDLYSTHYLKPKK